MPDKRKVNPKKLKELTLEDAASFASSKVKELRFEILERLSPECAEQLAKWKGRDLDLRGLTALDVTTAEHLSHSKSQCLKLHGIKQLPAEDLAGGREASVPVGRAGASCI